MKFVFFPKETSQINTVAQKFLDEFSEVTLTDGTMVAGFDLHTETVDRVFALLCEIFCIPQKREGAC